MSVATLQTTVTPEHPLRRSFGKVRQLPSGRWQASYLGPDRNRHLAPETFGTYEAADDWLTDIQRAIRRQRWYAPIPGDYDAILLGSYIRKWIVERDIKEKTRDNYLDLFEKFIDKQLGDTPLVSLTTQTVKAWYKELGYSDVSGACLRAAACSLQFGGA